VDVVQSQAGEDHVERAVLERQSSRVAILDFDAIRNALGPSVLEGGLRLVVGLVHALPYVHTDGLPALFSRLVAPINIRPRPQPTSRTISSPRHGMPSKSRSRSRNLPTLLLRIINAAVSKNPILAKKPNSPI
jgi:hypothetical protein